jgi:hypothetical protein
LVFRGQRNTIYFSNCILLLFTVGKQGNVTFAEVGNRPMLLSLISMLKKAQETVVFPERPTLSVVELLDFHKLRKPKKKQNQRRDLFYELEPVLPL